MNASTIPQSDTDDPSEMNNWGWKPIMGPFSVDTTVFFEPLASWSLKDINEVKTNSFNAAAKIEYHIDAKTQSGRRQSHSTSLTITSGGPSGKAAV